MNVPTATEVKSEVWACMADMQKAGCWDAYTDSIDIRLQVTTTGWCVKWGDPSYDLDHNGHWGFSTVDSTARTFADAGVIACELLDDVEESIAVTDCEDTL